MADRPGAKRSARKLEPIGKLRPKAKPKPQDRAERAERPSPDGPDRTTANIPAGRGGGRPAATGGRRGESRGRDQKRGGGRRYGRGQGQGRGRAPDRAPRDPVVETREPAPLPALRTESRSLLVVRDPSSDPSYGKRPRDRSIEELLRFGVVVLDKPSGPTSHQVVAWLRDILGVEKVGHGGTLDPKVTGVLPTTVGDATKTARSLLGAGKEYIAVMRLHGDAPEDKIRAEARRFVGVVQQVPPVRSAVARRLRRRRIYDLEVLDVRERDVLLRIASEAGTYIRNLCVDLGAAIGVRGHMAELRRSRTGTLHETDAVTLHDVRDAVAFWKEDGDETALRRCLLPFERVLAHFPRIVIRDAAVDAVCHGAALAAPGVAAMEESIKTGDLVVLYTGKGEAVALAQAEMEATIMAEATKGVVARTERVLMPTGVYPRLWKTGGGRAAAVARSPTDMGIF